MDELEQALAEYLASNFGRQDVVAFMQLQDDVATRFIGPDRPTSRALSTVRRFVRNMVRERVLSPAGSGRYYYWPSRDAPVMPEADSNQVQVTTRSSQVATVDATPPPPQRDPILELLTVSSLARSDRLLVQHDLLSIDVRALQELSF